MRAVSRDVSVNGRHTREDTERWSTLARHCAYRYGSQPRSVPPYTLVSRSHAARRGPSGGGGPKIDIVIDDVDSYAENFFHL